MKKLRNTTKLLGSQLVQSAAFTIKNTTLRKQQRKDNTETELYKLLALSQLSQTNNQIVITPLRNTTTVQQCSVRTWQTSF